MKLNLKRIVAIWIAVWLVGGLVGGLLLLMSEPGHLSRPVLPPLLGAVGILSGTVGGLLRFLLDAAVKRVSRRGIVTEVVIGAGIGLLIGIGLWRLGLGLPAELALSCGAALGTASGLGTGMDAGRSTTRSSDRPAPPRK